MTIANFSRQLKNIYFLSPCSGLDFSKRGGEIIVYVDFDVDFKLIVDFIVDFVVDFDAESTK